MLSIKNMTADRRWIPIAIVIFAALFRVAFLGIKPPHFDEGVNGWFLDDMTSKGYFQYDPGNYHGPLHFYILFAFKVLFGRNVWALRLPLVILSTATIWLVTKFDRFIDRRACWLAAAAMAVSPGMEFYGRYAIHETELVLFLILTVWGMAGIWRFKTVPYLWAAAMGVTGMILTKETYIIHLTAFALAGLCLWVLEKILPPEEPFPLSEKPFYSFKDLCIVASVCVLLIVFFYSGNFMDFSLLKGMYLTFAAWTKTGQSGNGHEKPFNYWLMLVTRYEWPVLVGMLCSVFYIWPKSDRLIRYLMIYGWGAFVGYSIVHYKTPWCIITIIWPFFFIFGHFFKEWMDERAGNATPVVVSGLLLTASLAASMHLSFKNYTDDSEPYVYVQTFPDMYKLTKPLFQLVDEDRANYHLTGHIIMESVHPLPWVLGDFDKIGYYDTSLPDADAMDATFLLVDKEHEEEVQKALKDDYFTTELRLRSSLEPAKLYLNYKKFHEMFPSRVPEFVQGKAVPAQETEDEETP